MKRWSIGILVVAMIVSIGSVAFARNGLNDYAGKSDVEHLYLYEKDITDWTVVPDGAYGKAVFNWKHVNVAFEGHGLAAETDYSLIFYSEVADGGWDEHKIQIISSGTSTVEGDLQLCRTAFEINVPLMEDPAGAIKVWLVPSASIIDAETLGWTNPEMFLFESRMLVPPTEDPA